MAELTAKQALARARMLVGYASVRVAHNLDCGVECECSLHWPLRKVDGLLVEVVDEVLLVDEESAKREIDNRKGTA